eukprot:PhF_6_TR31778/c2_g1_i2/m.46794
MGCCHSVAVVSSPLEKQGDNNNNNNKGEVIDPPVDEENFQAVFDAPGGCDSFESSFPSTTRSNGRKSPTMFPTYFGTYNTGIDDSSLSSDNDVVFPSTYEGYDTNSSSTATNSKNMNHDLFTWQPENNIDSFSSSDHSGGQMESNVYDGGW